MSFRMYVFVNDKLVVIETNPEVVAHWQHRKRLRAMDGVRITWKIEGIELPEELK